MELLNKLLLYTNLCLLLKLFVKCYIYRKSSKKLDYKKKSLKKLRFSECYEEIDARLASGWYVNSFGNAKKKEYKTKEVTFNILKNKKIK